MSADSARDAAGRGGLKPASGAVGAAGASSPLDPLAAPRADDAWVVLMRHPQTEANLAGTYLGQDEAPLSGLGREQAARAVEGLVAWRPDRVVCSPLSRCRAVAEPAAARLGAPCEPDPDVIELGFGELEGKTFEQASKSGIPVPWGDAGAAGGWPCAGGEPVGSLMERTARATARIAACEGRTAVVSHGCAIRALVCAFLGLGERALWRFSIKNVQSALVRVSGGVAFLAGLGLEPEELAGR